MVTIWKAELLQLELQASLRSQHRQCQHHRHILLLILLLVAIPPNPTWEHHLHLHQEVMLQFHGGTHHHMLHILRRHQALASTILHPLHQVRQPHLHMVCSIIHHHHPQQLLSLHQALLHQVMELRTTPLA